MATCYDEESLTERQENELQALKAIYFDVKDLRENDTWEIARPPEIQITLFPLESMGGAKAHVSVDLLVKCSSSYPDVVLRRVCRVPELHLSNAKGISTQQLDGLGEELRALARESVGEVMLLELCQQVQSCLHAHNKAPKSFYEEMLSNQRREQERAAQEQRRHNELQSRREQKQLQEIEEEIQRRFDAQKEETRRRREVANVEINETASEPFTPELESHPTVDTQHWQRVPLSPQRSTSSDGGGRKLERRSASVERRTLTPLVGQGDQHACDLHTGTATLTFNTKRERTVHRGKCLGHSDQGSTTYTAMDTHSGELLAVSEWSLRWNKHSTEQTDMADYMKQVTSIEQELLSLLRLRHDHLVHYHALNCHQDKDSITVHVLMDYVGGGSLSRCTDSTEPVPMMVLRHYTCQLLDALSYLHDKAVVHKDLRASSLLLDSSGNIRLADYSLNKRLSDLVAKFQKQIALNSQHASAIGRGSKKGDVYRLGVVLLSLSQGRSVTDLVVDLPTNIPRDFHDFLSKCLIRDERSRWSVTQLREHSFVKAPLASTIGVSVKASGDGPDRKQAGMTDEEEDGEEIVNIPFIPSSDSGSRLQNEFEILKFIGKGGFGDVIKVKNKLDTRLYAIKRIPLNPGNKQFTRKITREVKLLSQLNHENVVRYINSWIETSNEPVLSDSTSTSTATSDLPGFNPRSHQCINPTMPQNSLGVSDNIEKFAPAPVVEGSIEWSVSADIVSNHGNGEESSSEDEYDIEDVFGVSFLPFSDSDDDGIEFQTDSADTGKEKKDAEEESDVGIGRQSGSSLESVPKLQFLYIQMEFCEKSTLRTCIDTGLYEDMGRAWRLFHEVVEGLVHIHEQGIIHRDLKPVNIFLDVNDQVKIGDFGLATTDIISQLGQQQANVLDTSLTSDPPVSVSTSGSLGDGGLTGKVGTALYVSPEMMDTKAKAHYNQKVDIYSLGVILFEMCTPMATGMERVKVLSALRLASIDFPAHFDEVELENQAKIIRWLLNHDPGQRPTSLELLHSELLPPPQLQEAELNEVLRSTISDPDSKSYKRIVAAMFSQNAVPAKDFVYDNDFYKSAFCERLLLLQRHVTDAVEAIFRKHGAIKLSTPLLVPKSSVYDRCESYVCVMAHHGGLVTLPYDLRIHFARYLAHSNVTQLKRYSIECVYRELPLLGVHPRELMACAFDIVTPSPAGLIPDAEVLHVAWELVAEFPVLQARNYYVRMNHTSLLRAVLMYSGVSEELRHDVSAILGDNKAEKQKKLQIKTRLQGLSLSVQTVETLYNFIEAEDAFGRVASMLRCITKTNGPAAAFAKKGLHEMEVVMGHMASLGIKWKTVLAPGLVYNAHHFSGVIFQVVANMQRKKKTVMEVLAAGGRYDHLINEFRKSRSAPSFQCAVGISVSYDRMVAALQEDKAFVPPTTVDILVSTLGHRMLLKEKLALVKDLWSAGLRADIAHNATWSLEELQAYCKTSGVLYIVLLKDLESGTVRARLPWEEMVKLNKGSIFIITETQFVIQSQVRSLERDKYVEKKVNLVEVADYLQQRLQTLKWENTESNQSATSKTPSVSGQGSNDPPSHTGGTGNGLPLFSITFIPSDNTKLSKNTKRTYEAQIYSIVSAALANISQRSLVEILGLDLNGDVLKTIAANLELDDDEAVFERSLGSIIEKHLRFRKYLTKIFDYMHEQKYGKCCSVFLIFGLKDNSYKVLM